MPNSLPHLSFILPGTLLNTICPSYHDELFFHYPADCLPVFCDLFGQEIVQGKGISFSVIPGTTIAAIKRELEHYDELGVPDLLDQLAVQVVTRIFIQHRQEQQSDKSLHLKLHSIVSELAQGKKLCSVLKRYSTSERTFYREWNKAFSVSPKEYVQQYRLKSVCDLLTKTDLSISEISEKCGFSSSAYLYQIFQKKTGMSPRQFRQKKNRI
jgi:AraC-like DNA-binding protein